MKLQLQYVLVSRDAMREQAKWMPDDAVARWAMAVMFWATLVPPGPN